MIRSYPFAMVFVVVRTIISIPPVARLGELGIVSTVCRRGGLHSVLCDQLALSFRVQAGGGGGKDPRRSMTKAYLLAGAIRTSAGNQSTRPALFSSAVLTGSGHLTMQRKSSEPGTIAVFAH
jgi:hypothetical protein